MARSPAKKTSKSSTAIDPAAYSTFIRQIELKEIWLGDTSISGINGPSHPEDASVEVSSNTRYFNFDGGFFAFHQYLVRITAPSVDWEDEADSLPEEEEATIDVTFDLTFRLEMPMTNELFAVFQEVNLPVNTWPYLREFVASIMGRMGWQPVILPALKRITEPGGSATVAKVQRAQRN